MDFLLLKQQYRIEIGKTVHAAAAPPANLKANENRRARSSL